TPVHRPGEEAGNPAGGTFRRSPIPPLPGPVQSLTGAQSRWNSDRTSRIDLAQGIRNAWRPLACTRFAIIDGSRAGRICARGGEISNVFVPQFLLFFWS